MGPEVSVLFSQQSITRLYPEQHQHNRRLHHIYNNNNNNNNNKGQYVKLHDKVSAQIHFNICKETGVQLDKKHWYEHVPNQ
jgi:hypothetical protein